MIARLVARVARWALAGLVFAAAPALGYEESAIAGSGVLAGTVRFVGRPPAAETVPVARNRDVCGDRKPSETLMLGPDRGVRGSVVMIEGVKRGKKRTGDVVLDSQGCVFVSHVTAAPAGSRAWVKNSDPIIHNTLGVAGRTTVFNVAVPGKEQMVDISRRLTQPGVIRVTCDAHAHMAAWMVIHDSPYVAVTDERGAYRIDGVPPGTWRVTMWHEGYRRKGVDRDGRPAHDEPRAVTREVTLAPGARATLDFELR